MQNAADLMRDRPDRPSYTPMIWNSILLLGALFLGRQVVAGGPLLRIIAALALLAAFAIPAVERPQRAMVMLFAWLPFLGIVRRALVPATGFSALDPLLLVSSAIIILILATLILTGRSNMGGTVLSRMVFWLLLIGLLQVFNPGQGNLLVGLTGVMFVLVPMMCFFIGRSVADDRMIAGMQRVIIVAGIIAAAYGMYQVIVGFPGFEQAYLARAGFGGLYVGSAIRPMSTFTNPLEYATYLNFAVMTTLAYLVYKKGISRYWLWGALGFMVYSGYLIGSRGFVVFAALGSIILLGARAKNAFVALLTVAVLFGGIVYWTSTRTSTVTKLDETASAQEQLKQRQIGALTDPFDPKKSTLGVHYKGVMEGLIYAFTEQPYGLGTGSTGRGSTKFGGNKSSSTELDISDATIAFGVIGGVMYMGIIAVAGIQLFRMRRMLPGPMWPAVLGMAIVSFGQWLNGGNYAVAPLIWFMLGAADNAYMKVRDAKRLGLDPGLEPQPDEQPELQSGLLPELVPAR